MSAIFLPNDDPGDVVRPADVTMAKEISVILAKHYPGHPFMVHVDSQPNVGMGWIKHPMLSGKFGYRFKLEKLKSDRGLHEVIMGAGELLERWNVARGEYRHELMLQARKAFA